jgi:hypothetical protein
MPKDEVFNLARESTMTLMNIPTRREFDKMYDDPIMGWKIKKYVDEIYNAIQKGQQISVKAHEHTRH